MKFFIGTTNQFKVRELAAILNPTGCELEVTGTIDPDETEPDFVGNAIIKAVAYAQHVGGITISEDSGIIIPSLGGLPGVYSARFADCEIDVASGQVLSHNHSGRSREEIDLANNLRVLELMKGIEDPRRTAQFKVVMIVATSDGEILFNQSGEVNGYIATEMKGKNGFGYDKIFIGNYTGGNTFAELDSKRKNLRSHRKKVLKEFIAWLGTFLEEQKIKGLL